MAPTLNNNEHQFDALINNHLYFAFCTNRYKYQEDYSSQADLIINNHGMLFFFKFQDPYRDNL